MSELNEHVLDALRGELKLAFSPRVSAILGGIGSAGGVGAAAGALGGAVLKGGQKYRADRAEGASVTEALGGSLAHAGGGALKGAILGGAVGAAGGGALGAAKPELANRFRAAVTKLPGGQFGQRQVHTFTGWKPESGLGQIGHGAAPRKGTVDAAAKDWASAREGKDMRSLTDKLLGRSSMRGAEKRLHNASEAYNAGRKAEDMGLTSIPGYLKSLKNNGVGKTLGAAASDQWKGMSPGMKALMIGAPAAELAGAIRSPSGEDEQGRSKGERIGRSIAGTAAGTILSPLTFTGQMVAGTALSRAGAAAGRLASRKKPAGVIAPPGAPDLTADNGQAVAGERHISDRAAGSPGTEGFSA